MGAGALKWNLFTESRLLWTMASGGPTRAGAQRFPAGLYAADRTILRLVMAIQAHLPHVPTGLSAAEIHPFRPSVPEAKDLRVDGA